MLSAVSQVHFDKHCRACTVLQFNGPTDTLGTEPGRLMAAKRKAPAPKAKETGREVVRLNHGSTGLNLPEEKQEAIARMHTAGVPVTRIAGELGVSYHSVAALIRNRPDLLASARDITAANWKTLAAIGTAQLVDRLPEMKDQALSVLSAIATEKAELLQGNATQRIEVVAAPAADEWHDVVDGVVIESAPVPMGNAGRKRAAKGQDRPAAVSAPGADGEQPLVSGLRYSDAVDIVPEFEATGPGFLPPPPPTDRGGEAVRRSSRPSLPDSLDDSEIFRKST